MKKLYHLTITLACTVFSITARLITTKKPLTTAKTAPTSSLPTNGQPSAQLPTPPSIKTYKQLRDDIAAMDPNLVVAPDGIFTDYFINFIKENVQKSKLSGVFTRALLDAGINFHASLNQDNAFTQRTLQRNTQHIEDILNSLKPTLPVRPQEKQISIPTITPSQSPVQPQKPQQPIPPVTNTKPEPIVQPTAQSQLVEYKKNLSGPAGLKEFRKQSTNEPIEAFYDNSKVSPQWLARALQIVLAGQPLTARNKEQMQGELVGNATELMRELLHKNHVANNAWHTFLENVKQQVIVFIDSQPLQDQKQSSPSLPKTKTPHVEPLSPQPKVPAPEPKPKQAQKPDSDPRLPTWITSQQTLAIKGLETEILRYIFKNQEASQETIEQHFIQQVPKNIKLREILINGIKATVGKILQEPLGPDLPLEAPQTTDQKASSKNKLPHWINAKGGNIKPSNLDQEIAQFIARNMNADNDAIANHFISLVPNDMPHKKLIERQIRDTIEDFLAR